MFDLPAPPDVSDSVRAAVRSVLDALLEPGELDDWSIGWEQDLIEVRLADFLLSA